jgi:hypothetical protein
MSLMTEGAELRLVEFIAKSVVDHPEQVLVTLSDPGDGSGLIEIKANPDDYGKIIGKRGRIIHSIRALVTIVSRESRKRWNIQLPERPGQDHEAEDDADARGGDRT